jgi:hypothetical protein
MFSSFNDFETKTLGKETSIPSRVPPRVSAVLTRDFLLFPAGGYQGANSGVEQPCSFLRYMTEMPAIFVLGH